MIGLHQRGSLSLSHNNNKPDRWPSAQTAVRTDERRYEQTTSYDDFPTVEKQIQRTMSETQAENEKSEFPLELTALLPSAAGVERKTHEWRNVCVCVCV